MAIFIEVSGTDKAIEEMSEKIASLEKLAKRAPRFEFGGIKTSVATNGNTMAAIQFVNTSDIDAVSYRAVANIKPREEWPIQADFDELSESVAAYSLDAMPEGAHISRGMGLALPAIEINPTDTDDYANNKRQLYVTAIVEYATKVRDNNEYWRTEVCAKITKPFTGFEGCPAFNQYKHMKNGEIVSD